MSFPTRAEHIRVISQDNFYHFIFIRVTRVIGVIRVIIVIMVIIVIRVFMVIMVIRVIMVIMVMVTSKIVLSFFFSETERMISSSWFEFSMMKLLVIN